MRALLLVEVVEVRLVLEVVGVHFTILGGGVRLNVIGELLGGGAVGARVAAAGQTEGRERGDGEQRAEKLLVTHG